MSEIKKMLFSVSEKGNPMAQIWVDDADINKNSDSIYIALKNQVAYLFFLTVGSQIAIKQSKQYKNIEVPDTFTGLFEGYKVSPDPTIKMIGGMMNNAFNNTFDSISFLKNGEIVRISQDEANAKCEEYMEGYTSLYETALQVLGNSKIKALKSIAKVLEKEDSKPADIKEANGVVMGYAMMLNREVINKNNFVIEKSENTCPFDEDTEAKQKKTKSK